MALPKYLYSSNFPIVLKLFTHILSKKLFTHIKKNIMNIGILVDFLSLFHITRLVIYNNISSIYLFTMNSSYLTIFPINS
jgi:hypothetical protein